MIIEGWGQTMQHNKMDAALPPRPFLYCAADSRVEADLLAARGLALHLSDCKTLGSGEG